MVDKELFLSGQYSARYRVDRVDIKLELDARQQLRDILDLR
jgi:hypothetical protein